LSAVKCQSEAHNVSKLTVNMRC